MTTDGDGKEKITGNKESKRNFLKAVLTVGALGVIIGVAGFFRDYLTFIPGSNEKNLSWPRLKIVNLKDLKELTPIQFNYPLDNTPNVLVKLGAKADNGIGPDIDIVAFSLICQHLGCIYEFIPKGKSPQCNPSYTMPDTGGYCCCHGSHYNFTKNGAVMGGPSPRPQPMVRLELDDKTGDIYAVSMGPPSIYGHGNQGDTSPQAVLVDDLQGGNIVAGAVTTTERSSATGTNSTRTSRG
jgi:arsenite oxidase small subunit